MIGDSSGERVVEEEKEYRNHKHFYEYNSTLCMLILSKPRPALKVLKTKWVLVNTSERCPTLESITLSG